MPWNRAAALLLLAAGPMASCGGDAPTAPSPPVPETQTFMGTTRATSPNSCSSDSHDFQATDGLVTVTLVQTTGGTALVVQVCAGGIDDNNCTINQTRITVGQSLSGTRKGGASQNLKLLPLNCGGGGPPPAMPIDYTVMVSYLR